MDTFSANDTIPHGRVACIDAQKATEGDQSRNATRLPELDGLRGIAILLVVIWHYWAINLRPGPGIFARFAGSILGLSWSGVDLFFVLSGFLIGGILLDHREAANYFKVFYTRRICRIVPLYYSVLVLFLLSMSFGPAFTARFPHLFDKSISLWSYLSFTQNFAMANRGDFGPGWLGVTWSLAIEEQFYILLPLIIHFVPTRKLPPLLCSLFVLAIAVRIFVSGYHPESFIPSFVLMPCRVDSLMLGVLCAYAVRKPGVAEYLRTHLRQLYAILGLLAVVVGWTALGAHQPGSVSMMIYGYSLLALCYACILLIAISEKRGVVSLVTRNPILRFFGLIAYGVYLLHEPVYGLCHGLLPSQNPQSGAMLNPLVTGMAFGVTVALATVSWLWFEKKFITFGHSLKYLRPSQISPLTSALAPKAQ